MESLTKDRMIAALNALDAILPKTLTLIVGGGGAMLLAYNFPLATADIDAVAKGLPEEELKEYILRVARDLNLPPDWLNSWYSSFTHVLPADYADRLVNIFTGKKLTALALSKQDLLLMKCFAGRKKDITHARVLVRGGADTGQVEKIIEALQKRQIPGAAKALEFLDDILDMENL
jgi:hypothetical protein